MRRALGPTNTLRDPALAAEAHICDGGLSRPEATQQMNIILVPVKSSARLCPGIVELGRGGKLETIPTGKDGRGAVNSQAP